MQIDSYMELPKEKRPPKDIWDKPNALDHWFDRVFDRKSGKPYFEIDLDEVE